MRFTLLFAVLLGIYPATYYSVLALPEDFRLRPPQFIYLEGTWFSEGSPFIMIDGQRFPDFHGVPSFLLAPMYRLDAHLIRPKYWRPFPRNMELNFEVALPSAPIGL